MKSGSLNLLGLTEPVQVFNGIALPLLSGVNYEDSLVELPAGGFVITLHEARLVSTLHAARIASVVHNDVIYQDVGIVLSSPFLALSKCEVCVTYKRTHKVLEAILRAFPSRIHKAYCSVAYDPSPIYILKQFLLVMLLLKDRFCLLQILYNHRFSHRIHVDNKCLRNNFLYLSKHLTNLMHKICFTLSFISCLYMFRAHMLIIRRSKLHYTASGIITTIGAHHQEVKIALHSLWYHHTYRCDDTRGCLMQF